MVPPTRRTWTHRTLAVVALAGTATMVYELSAIFSQHSSWNDFRTPVGVGEILNALVSGLIAVAAAAGLDLRAVVNGSVGFRPKGR